MGVSSKKHLFLDNKRFILITAGLIGIVFLGASFIPSIWDAFQFTGATAAAAVPYSVVLNDIVRVTYVVHLMAVFPLIFFALRLNLDGLVFPAKKHLVLDNKWFILITAGLIGIVFLGASFIPSIWDAFQFIGGHSSRLYWVHLPSFHCSQRHPWNLNQEGHIHHIVHDFSGSSELPVYHCFYSMIFPKLNLGKYVIVFTVVPVIVTPYICHYNVHSIYNELEDPSEMQPIVRTSLALCSIVYISTCFFGFLLFGDQTMDDVLANFDTNLGFPYSVVLNDIVRVTYVVHLMLVFPLIFFALRLNLDGLVFPVKKHLVLDNKRFTLITAGSIGIVFLGASFIPSIWDAFQFTGATAAVCIGLSSQLPLLSETPMESQLGRTYLSHCS